VREKDINTQDPSINRTSTATIAPQPLNAAGGVIHAQSPQAFTTAAPFRVDVMTNVAVR